MAIDIANNIRAVELLKLEILQKVTDLFGDISPGADNETFSRISQDSAALISLTYLLSSRLGVKFDDINEEMKKSLLIGIKDNHILERKYGDLSELLDCISLEKRREIS
ncbi:MAG: MazG-like family protein [Oscillospiraceae bacterium]